MRDTNKPTSPPVPESTPDGPWRQLYQSEDWWAIWIGFGLLALCLLAVLLAGPAEDGAYASPLKSCLTKPGSWSNNPIASFFVSGEKNALPGVLGVGMVSLLAFGLGAAVMGKRFASFAGAFCFVFLLGTFAYVLAGQSVIKHYSLSYALWALVSGLLISNTIGTPHWARPAIRTEFFIKTGLVVFGAADVVSAQPHDGDHLAGPAQRALRQPVGAGLFGGEHRGSELRGSQAGGRRLEEVASVGRVHRFRLLRTIA